MPEENSGPIPTVVALGASNTEGYGVGAANAFPAVIARLLQARGVAAHVSNAGISGNTTGEMLARLDHAVPNGTRIVLFQPGSNDARLGLSEAERARNIAMTIAKLGARGIKVIPVAAAFEAARPGNLLPDGIHYCVAGHAAIAHLLVDEVAAALAD